MGTQPRSRPRMEAPSFRPVASENRSGGHGERDKKASIAFFQEVFTKVRGLLPDNARATLNNKFVALASGGNVSTQAKFEMIEVMRDLLEENRQSAPAYNRKYTVDNALADIGELEERLSEMQAKEGTTIH